LAKAYLIGQNRFRVAGWLTRTLDSWYFHGDMPKKLYLVGMSEQCIKIKS